MGQFNAATAAARGGDMEAAKGLPQLSQALLSMAADFATSRQELDRIRAQTAASLEATYGMINGLVAGNPSIDNAALLQAVTESQPSTQAVNDNGAASLATQIEGLKQEIAQMRAENNSGHAATAANTGAIKRTLDNVTSQSGGDAISTVNAA